jgi:predicted transposase YdaD
MCNYSQFLVQKGKAEGKAEGREEGREEQKIKDKLDFLEELEADHFSDKQIMRLLRVDAEHLKSLREMLQEKRAAVMAD